MQRLQTLLRQCPLEMRRARILNRGEDFLDSIRKRVYFRVEFALSIFAREVKGRPSGINDDIQQGCDGRQLAVVVVEFTFTLVSSHVEPFVLEDFGYLSETRYRIGRFVER